MQRHLAITAVTLALLGGWATSAPRQAAATDPDPYPELIICEVNGVTHYAWLDLIETDGTAVYMTGSESNWMISKDGAISREEGGLEGNCAGKTVDDLMARGDARFVTK